MTCPSKRTGHFGIIQRERGGFTVQCFGKPNNHVKLCFGNKGGCRNLHPVLVFPVFPNQCLNRFNKSDFLIRGIVLLCHICQNRLRVNCCNPLCEFLVHFLRFGKMHNDLDGMPPSYSFLVGKVYAAVLVQYLRLYLADETFHVRQDHSGLQG